jgi:hypothetical protein
MDTFFINDLIIILSSTCFEQPSVQLQEDLYMQFYGISSRIHISSMVDGRKCLIINSAQLIFNVNHPEVLFQYIYT